MPVCRSEREREVGMFGVDVARVGEEKEALEKRVFAGDGGRRMFCGYTPIIDQKSLIYHHPQTHSLPYLPSHSLPLLQPYHFYYHHLPPFIRHKGKIKKPLILPFSPTTTPLNVSPSIYRRDRYVTTTCIRMRLEYDLSPLLFVS